MAQQDTITSLQKMLMRSSETGMMEEGQYQEEASSRQSMDRFSPDLITPIIDGINSGGNQRQSDAETLTSMLGNQQFSKEFSFKHKDVERPHHFRVNSQSKEGVNFSMQPHQFQVTLVTNQKEHQEYLQNKSPMANPVMDIVHSRAEEEEETSTLTNHNIKHTYDNDTTEEDVFITGKSPRLIDREGYNYQ